MPGIAKHNRNLILRRLRQGDYLNDIAEPLNIHASAISHAFRCDSIYLKARRIGHERRVLFRLTRPRKEPLHWEQIRYLHSFGATPFAVQMGWATHVDVASKKGKS